MLLEKLNLTTKYVNVRKYKTLTQSNKICKYRNIFLFFLKKNKNKMKIKVN